MISQTQRIAQRVDLVLAFMQFGFHIGEVRSPLVFLKRTGIKGIGIGVDIDALELTQDHAAQHFLEFRVFVGKLYIRPYLGTRIAQPHRCDIAGIDEGIILAVEMHRCVDGIGKTVFEHPCQIGIVLQLLLHFLDFLLYCIRTEQSVSLGRSLGHIGRFISRMSDILLGIEIFCVSDLSRQSEHKSRSGKKFKFLVHKKTFVLYIIIFLPFI